VVAFGVGWDQPDCFVSFLTLCVFTCRHTVHSKAILSRQDVAEVLNRLPTIARSPATNESSKTLLGCAKELGEKLALAVASSEPSLSDEGQDLQPCLGVVGKLLLSSSFASTIASPPLALALCDGSKETLFPAAPEADDDEEDGLLTETLVARQDALNDLNEAMQMLRTELTLSSLMARSV
jgi:hypothetical protein